MCGHTLAVAQGVPDLSGFDAETRQSIELACITQKGDGPLAYGSCLSEQIHAVRASPGIPSLSGFDAETRQSIELACITQKGDGPVAFGSCLSEQIHAVRTSPGIPSLSGVHAETRQSIELACITQKGDGPVAYGGCLRAQLLSIGVQPVDTTRVQSARPKRTDRKAAPIAPTSSTGLSQVTRRQHMGFRSIWQDPSFVALLVLLIVAFVYLTPVLWVLLSSRSHGGAKLGWFLVVLFFSWLGLAVFLIVTQALRNRGDT
jgi:hypothetical protein